MDRLIEIVTNLDEDDMVYILSELGREQNINIANFTSDKLTSSDIEILKEAIKFLIKEDSEFRDKFSSIVKNYQPTRSIDAYSAGVMIVGIFTIGNIANNIIRAKYPSKESISDDKVKKETIRDYENLSDVIKYIAQIIPKKDKDEER